MGAGRPWGAAGLHGPERHEVAAALSGRWHHPDDRHPPPHMVLGMPTERDIIDELARDILDKPKKMWAEMTEANREHYRAMVKEKFADQLALRLKQLKRGRRSK